MYRIPILYANTTDDGHVRALQRELGNYGFESVSHRGCAVKEHDKAVQHASLYKNVKVPIITVDGGTDFLSGAVAYHNPNLVIASRPDWSSSQSLDMFHFSSLGTLDYTAVVSVLGPGQTARYIKKVIDMAQKSPDDMSIPFISKNNNELTQRFGVAIDEIGGGLRARQADFGEVSKAPVCVLFRHRSEDQAIDKTLESTESPVILTPHQPEMNRIQQAARGSFKSGYHPDIAMALLPEDAALAAAQMVGLFNDEVREAVGRYRSRNLR